MRYAKKVRLALALLIKMVAIVVEVLWWNLGKPKPLKKYVGGPSRGKI